MRKRKQKGTSVIQAITVLQPSWLTLRVAHALLKSSSYSGLGRHFINFHIWFPPPSFIISPGCTSWTWESPKSCTSWSRRTGNTGHVWGRKTFGDSTDSIRGRSFEPSVDCGQWTDLLYSDVLQTLMNWITTSFDMFRSHLKFLREFIMTPTLHHLPFIL